MPIHERPIESIEQFYEALLDQHRVMFESGTQLAITAAMDCCDRYGLTPPTWVVTESVKLQCALLRGGTPKRRGRSTGTVDRYRQDAIDYARWDAVNEVRENRKMLRDKVNALSKLPGRTAKDRRIECEKLLQWAEADSFRRASTLLEGSSAFGGPEAVKTSFLKVKRNLRNQSTAMRYHILDADFHRKFSDRTTPSDNSGKKIEHLFDLTK